MNKKLLLLLTALSLSFSTIHIHAEESEAETEIEKEVEVIEEAPPSDEIQNEEKEDDEEILTIQETEPVVLEEEPVVIVEEETTVKEEVPEEIAEEVPPVEESAPIDEPIVEAESAEEIVEESAVSFQENAITICTINVYVNDIFKTSTQINDIDYQEILYGTFPIGYIVGYSYGTFESATATVNGKSVKVFDFDAPEYLYIFNSLDNSNIILNLYYKNESETPPPIIYGTVELDIQNGNNYLVKFTGKKGIDIVEKEIYANESGMLYSNEFDISYKWSYVIENSTFEVDFDLNNEYYSQHSIKSDDDEPVIIIPSPVVSVLYQLSADPGGVMEDGNALNHFIEFGPFEVPGEYADNNESIHNYCTSFLAENDVSWLDKNIIFNEDTFSLGSVYKTKDVVTFNYTLKEPIYQITINYLNEQGKVIFDPTIRRLIGSTNTKGPKNYSIDIFKINNYEFKESSGDPLEGELDSDKIINLIYTKPAPRPTPPSDPDPEPTPTPTPIPPEPEPEPTPAPTPTPPTVVPTNPIPQIITPVEAEVIEPEPTPAPSAAPVEVEIEEPEVPLVAPGNWALINLITTILSVIIALGMLLTGLFKKTYEEDDNSEDEEDKGKHKKSKIFGIFPAILSVLLFLMTEDIRLPMVLVDKWTLPMIIILIISIILAYLTKNKKKEENEEEDS